jgi:hypothetical protein
MGLAALALSQRTIARAGAVMLSVLMVWQFAAFYRDYHTSFRIGSGHVYDPTAFREAATLVIENAEQSAGGVYLPANFYDVGAKWRFYTQKHDRPALLRRTKYFADASTLAAAPPDSIAVLPAASASAGPPPGWTTVGVVRNLMGEPASVVIRRQQ